MLPLLRYTDDAIRPIAQTKLRLLRGRFLFARSAIGRVFAQAIVNSIFLVDNEPELQQLAVDFGNSPIQVLLR